MFEFKDVENLSESKNLNEEKDNFVFTADVVPAAATRCHKRGLFYRVVLYDYFYLKHLYLVLYFLHFYILFLYFNLLKITVCY